MLEVFNFGLQSSLFYNIGIVIIVATIVGFVARLLKQPLIPAYVLAGFLIGPLGFALITEESVIISLSEIGIAFLLFIVGLEINLKKLKGVGVASAVIGLVQVGFVFLVGFLIARSFNFLPLEAIYIGLILTLSSTMIVIKLLSDKNELNTLHGRIILTVLLLQDVVIIFVLSILGTFKNFVPDILFISILRGLFLIMLVVLLGKYVLPLIFKFSARSGELLFLSSITVCFLFSLLAYSMDFSIAIGAFLAGLSLASLPYHSDIAGRIIPLRDFFATLFFVSLGMGFVFGSVKGLIVPLFVFLGVVIVLKPLVLMIMSSIFGYKKRTGFLTATSLAQISEFSLILVALGFNLGHVSDEIFGMTVLIAIITIALTSYLVKYNNKLYGLISSKLDVFEKMAVKRAELEHFPYHSKKDIIIFGAHRMGAIFINMFSKLKNRFVVVDFDPQIIVDLISKRVPCVYGDATNYEVLKRLNLHSAKIVVSTTPNIEDNLFLIKYVRDKNPRTIIVVTAPFAGAALRMYEHGADYVIIPHLLGGEMVSHLLEELIKGKRDIKEIRLRHIRYLRENNF